MTQRMRNSAVKVPFEVARHQRDTAENVFRPPFKMEGTNVFLNTTTPHLANNMTLGLECGWPTQVHTNTAFNLCTKDFGVIGIGINLNLPRNQLPSWISWIVSTELSLSVYELDPQLSSAYALKVLYHTPAYIPPSLQCCSIQKWRFHPSLTLHD